MSITRVQVEQLMSRRIGAYLAEAGMTAEGGVNPWLTDPLGWALRALGMPPASLVDVDDADLAGITAEYVDALLDLVELRALEAALTNLTDVTVSAGPLSVKPGELPDRLRELVTAKRQTAGALYAHLLAMPLDGAGDVVVRLRAL